MKRLMKVLEFSTRWYDLPVFFSSYIVIQHLSCLQAPYIVSRLSFLSLWCFLFLPPLTLSTPLIHHIPCLVFKVKQFLEIISFRRATCSQRRQKFFNKFYCNWIAWTYLVASFVASFSTYYGYVPDLTKYWNLHRIFGCFLTL